MTWDKNRPYHDVFDRTWWVVAEANVKGDTILAVAMWMTGAPNIYAIAVADPVTPTATVLLDDGPLMIFGTDEEGERMKLESLTIKPDMHPLGDMGAWVDGYNITIQLSTESYEEASEVLDMMRECDGKDIEVMLKKRVSE